MNSFFDKSLSYFGIREKLTDYLPDSFLGPSKEVEPQPRIPSEIFYIIKDDEVFFRERKVEGADAATFKRLDWYYGRDANHVYYQEYLLDELDAATFTSVKHKFLRDKNGVYLFFCRRKVYGADPDSFEMPFETTSYSRDKSHVYYDNLKIEGTDRDSFEVIDYKSARDKNHYYEYGEKIDENSKNIKTAPESLSSLHFANAKASDETSEYLANRKQINDSQYYIYNGAVYYYFDKISGSHPRSFMLLGGGFAKDKNNVYWYGRIIEGADTQYFVWLKDDYGCDRKAIYYQAARLENCDVKSFELLNRKVVKDAHSVYVDGVRIEGVDIDSFELLDWFYSKDRYSVYYESHVVQDADPVSFKGFGFFAKDKKNIFFKERKIHGADVETFRAFPWGDYAKDKNAAYYGADLIKDADSATFVVYEVAKSKDIEIVYAIDKSNVYFRGKRLHGKKPQTFDLKELM